MIDFATSQTKRMETEAMQTKKGIRIIIFLICALLFVMFAVIAFHPWTRKNAKATEQQMVEQIAAFRKISEAVCETTQDENSEDNQLETVQEYPNDPIWKAMQSYNQNLKKSQNFGTQWFSQYDESLAQQMDIDNRPIGVVTIPALNLEFPLYASATSNHLSSGLAVATNSSYPIGGAGTNSVIVGHRGWDTGDFLIDADKIAVGDEIKIQNLWEELTYKVRKIEIVDPYDYRLLRVQDGVDCITLYTCHPYGSGGKYRMLIVAYREPEQSNILQTETTKESESQEPPMPSALQESGLDAPFTTVDTEPDYGIWLYRALPWICATLVIATLLAICIISILP